jgi:hypothetical protein
MNEHSTYLYIIHQKTLIGKAPGFKQMANDATAVNFNRSHGQL